MHTNFLVDVLWTRLERRQEEQRLHEEAEAGMQGHHVLHWQAERHERLQVMHIM